MQFSVKNEQKLDCGGGYIKLIPNSVRCGNCAHSTCTQLGLCNTISHGSMQIASAPHWLLQ